MRVVLHTCCGPCASACIPALRARGHNVVLYYSNSNIDTREEFEKRLEYVRKLAEADGVEVFADDYNHADWLEKVARGFENEPEKGVRCERCFRYNLERTAKFVKENGFDSFATSLTVSPHKVSPVIFAQGEEAGGEKFLKEDFKKKNGFIVSVTRAKELGLYRQNYCGCEFSKR